MRLIKMFGLASVAAVAAMALVGATSASATSTQLCTSHTGLTCGSAASTVHQVLAAGTIWELLATISVLCLGYLVEASAGALGAPQTITSTTQTFSGCGTSSTHTNCTVSIPTGKQPVFGLLKTGLDAGILTTGSGQMQLVCANLSLNCLYDLAGMEFSVGGGHLTANNTRVEELGKLFICDDEAFVDALLETLTSAYVLG